MAGEAGASTLHTPQTSAPAREPPKAPPDTTTPLRPQVKVLTRDESPEPSPAPLWATFCGLAGGGWQGVAAAVAPATGLAEPLAPGPDGKPLLVQACYCVEARDGETGALARRSVRAPDAAGLAAAAERGAWLDEGVLDPREPGMIIFDGGSYSRGPLSLLVSGDDGGGELGERPPPPEALDAEAERARLERLVRLSSPDPSPPPADALADFDVSDPRGSPDIGDVCPPTVSVLEACVAWGGEARLRVQLTLAVSEGTKDCGVERGCVGLGLPLTSPHLPPPSLSPPSLPSTTPLQPTALPARRRRAER